MGKYLLEVCVDSVESAMEAQQGGADRLELCGDLAVGGVTPSMALYERVREHVNIPVHVLLRPRWGDFLYSDEEFEILLRQANTYRLAGAEALVIGCLTREGRLDRNRMGRLMETIGGRPVTLHRAFDMCADLEQALDDAKQLGVAAILTSGGCTSALEGREVLKRLKEQAGAVDIMAGAGIDAAAIARLLRETPVTSFHMSGKRTVPSSMCYRNPRVHMGLPGLSEYERWQTDAGKVRQAREVLDGAERNIHAARPGEYRES